MVFSLDLQAQNDRYFRNPFVTNSSEGARLVNREWVQKNMRILLDKILSRKIPGDEYEKDGPYTGPPGIVYALFRAIKANSQLILHKDIRRILSDQAGNLPGVSKSHECRYLRGTLGFYTIEAITDAFLSKHENTSTLSIHFNKLYKRILRPNYQDRGDDEMLNGRAGFLAALLEIRTTMGKNILPSEEIRKILNKMIASGRKYSEENGSPANLMYEWHESEYLGAAHGISGIYQMLMSFYDLLDASSKSDLKQSIDWLLSIQFTDGNFPSRSGKKEEEKIHWCHGAPGVLQMLIMAYLVFNEAKYLQSAEKCADLIWAKGILRKGPGLCHGVAGNGYSFLLLYRLTRNEQHLDRAKAFALVMMSSSFGSLARTPDSPWSLFEGWSGALCFLADLLNPTEAQFPLIPISFK